MTEYNDDLYTSKSEQKRDDLVLQELGQSLMALKQSEQDRLPLGDSLRKGLEEARRITSNEARRRHSLYIGRLVRESNSDQIEPVATPVIAWPVLHPRASIPPTPISRAPRKYLT